MVRKTYPESSNQSSVHPWHLSVIADFHGDEESQESLKDRLVRARSGMKLLLFAWARYEDETPEGNEKDSITDARLDWGRVARKFLMSN